MEPPIYPEKSDCCGSGCNPCIFDIYDQQLAKYNKFLKDGDTDQQIKSTDCKNCLNEMKYTPFILISIKKLSEDTNFYTFQHETCDNCSLSHKPGQHLFIKVQKDSDENISRAYTLIPSENNDKNCFTVMVKLYETGKMSNYFRNLKIGSQTYWRGPYGDYKLNKNFKHILMICQGTGLAPFYSILNQQLNDSECEIFFKLLFCCHNIYFREKLYKMASYWNFTYEIYQNRKCDPKRYGEVIYNRRVTENDIDDYFSDLETKGIENGVQVLICGSDNFNVEMKNILLKYDQKCSLYIF